MSDLDKRLFAVRADLADMRLKGRVEAARFSEGVPAQCAVPVAGVFRSPSDDAMQLTQMLWGEALLVFEQSNGWSWVQLDGDSYVGYVRDTTSCQRAFGASLSEARHQIPARDCRAHER
jgi:hypothetical protein